MNYYYFFVKKNYGVYYLFYTLKNPPVIKGALAFRTRARKYETSARNLSARLFLWWKFLSS